jgi:chromosome segregation ATPase
MQPDTLDAAAPAVEALTEIAMTTTAALAPNLHPPSSPDNDSELERLRSHLMEAEQQHTEELMSMQQRIEQLEEELRERQHSSMRASDESNVEALRALDLKCQELQISNRQLESKVAELSRLLDGYETAKQTELDLAVGRLQMELEQSQAATERLKADLKDERTEVNTLQSHLSDKQREIDLLQNQRTNFLP